MGARGLADAKRMTDWTARALGCPAREVLVASTGVIGRPLPLEKLARGIPAAAGALAPDGLPRAARAILTTDTRPKLAWRRIRLGARTVTLAGIAKGAGMIQPDLATMLAFLVTDAGVAPALLRRLLRDAAQESFNRLTIDGETSTSDTLLLFANGRAGGPELHGPRSAGLGRFEAALADLCQELARELARDGEGAKRLVTVRVDGARSDAEALRAGRRIANSPLVKTAVFGADPNWGRILQAVGAARVRVNLPRTEVRLADVAVFRAGAPTGPGARARAGARMRRTREVEIAVRLGAGRGRARLWTCDYSYDYVRINAEYTT
jgi:glutamate N-acetyltransferase/amino-acid N-acetyltransferase